MSKTETWSEALKLADEQEASLLAVMNGEMKIGRLSVEPFVKGCAELRRLDAEVRELKMTVQHESLCVEAAKERIEALDAENKALRPDAERYRWLRVQPDDCSAPRIDICHWTCEPGDSANNGEGLRGEAADQAIDAAMAEAKNGDAA
jgi:hypothetical protein